MDKEAIGNTIESLENEFEALKGNAEKALQKQRIRMDVIAGKVDRLTGKDFYRVSPTHGLRSVVEEERNEALRNTLLDKAGGITNATKEIQDHLANLLDLGYKIDHILVSKKGNRRLHEEHELRKNKGYAIVFNSEIKVAKHDETWPNEFFKVVIQ